MFTSVDMTDKRKIQKKTTIIIQMLKSQTQQQIALLTHTHTHISAYTCILYFLSRGICDKDNNDKRHVMRT